LDEAKHVKIDLTDISGRVISTLINRYVEPGRYSMDINGTEFLSGVYIVIIRIENEIYKSSLLIKN
jgi:hypothetical protein